MSVVKNPRGVTFEEEETGKEPDAGPGRAHPGSGLRMHVAQASGLRLQVASGVRPPNISSASNRLSEASTSFGHHMSFLLAPRFITISNLKE